MCAVNVGGQPRSHGLLGEGRGAGHPEPSRGPERREGGGASLEGEEQSRVAKDHFEFVDIWSIEKHSWVSGLTLEVL